MVVKWKRIKWSSWFLCITAILLIFTATCSDKKQHIVGPSALISTGVGWGSSITLDSLSQPYIAYGDDSKDSIKYTYWNDGVWIKEVVYEFNKDYLNMVIKTHLNLDLSNRAHIHFCNRNELDFKYLVKEGSEWLVQTIEQPTGCSAKLKVDSQGNSRMVYINDNESKELLYSILSPTPATTVVKGLLPDASYPFLNLFIDPEDDAHIGIVEVQTDGNGLEQKTFFRIFQNGVTWQEESNSIQYELISLALDSNDVFKGLFFNREGLSYYYGEFLAGNWGFEKVTMPQSTESTHFGLNDLELDSNNQPWFYGDVKKFHFREEEGYSEYFFDILVVHKSNGEWQSNILEVNSWGIDTQPSMSIDPSGNLHLSYCFITFIKCPDRNFEAKAALYYATWDGDDWNIEKVDE